MGQQQLLLLVLGIVIVGLAVVAGINAFEENQTKSSQDAQVNEAFRLATDAKAWYNKPTAYDGGGSDPTELSNMTWGDIGVQDESLSDTDNSNASGDYETPWGTISLNAANPVEFDVSTKEGGNFGTVTFDPSGDPQISFTRSGS